MTFFAYNVSMSTTADAKRDLILTSALGVFGRYGYKRTSMDLIAQAAGVSRAALYQHFANKEQVFRAVVGRMLDDLILAAETEVETAETVADKLYGALAARLDVLGSTVEAEFRSELFGEAATMADDLMRSFRDRQVAILERVLDDASGKLDLGAASAGDTAQLLYDALTGISQEQEPVPVLRARLRQLVELAVRGLARKTER